MCGGQYNWRNPNRVSVIQESADPSEATVFRAHAPPPGACENLVCTLKFLANEQPGGDSPVQVLVEAVQELSRLKMMDEFGRFITRGGENRRPGEVLGGAPRGRVQL